jgi:hypothetical protein
MYYARLAKRRSRIEESYERLIVDSARTVVNANTTPERREQARGTLLSACSTMGAFHGLNTVNLYLGAIERASKEGNGQ